MQIVCKQWQHGDGPGVKCLSKQYCNISHIAYTCSYMCIVSFTCRAACVLIRHALTWKFLVAVLKLLYTLIQQMAAWYICETKYDWNLIFVYSLTVVLPLHCKHNCFFNPSIVVSVPKNNVDCNWDNNSRVNITLYFLPQQKAV